MIIDCNDVAISEVTFFLLVSELSKEFWFVIRLSYAKQCILNGTFHCYKAVRFCLYS